MLNFRNDKNRKKNVFDNRRVHLQNIFKKMLIGRFHYENLPMQHTEIFFKL